MMAVNDLVCPVHTPLKLYLHCAMGCFELAQYVSPLSGHGVYLKNK